MKTIQSHKLQFPEINTEKRENFKNKKNKKSGKIEYNPQNENTVNSGRNLNYSENSIANINNIKPATAPQKSRGLKSHINQQNLKSKSIASVHSHTNNLLRLQPIVFSQPEKQTSNIYHKIVSSKRK